MKNVFITGAGSGLGREAAIALSRRGHKVIATTQYENQVEPLQKMAEDDSLNLEVFKLDILREEEREKILNYDVDVFIMNSAIGDSGSVSDIDIDRIKNVFETNVFCNLRTVQLALRKMIDVKNNGRIIFISSLVGRITMPFLSPYCASKFALEGFASSLRKEMKKLPNSKIEIGIIEFGAYATGFNKENNEKKYEWMYENSYFKTKVKEIRKKETLLWNFLEVKPFKSAIKKYIKVVETKKLKERYTTIWWQALAIQFMRIIGK